MKNFVLVHGAWQGNYSWFMVKEKLESLGHRVIDVKLPGHGKDGIDTSLLTLDDYSNAVIDQINLLNDKVYLVGHSLGGIVISSVAEKIASKIAGLIYIAAYVPESGQSLNQLRIENIDSAVKDNTVFSPQSQTIDILHDKIIEIFYHDVAEFQKLAMDNHHPEPVSPFKDPIELTKENFGQLPKSYIHTLNDRAIPYSFQKIMAERAKISHEYFLTCGHMPQLALPDKLISILWDITADIN